MMKDAFQELLTTVIEPLHTPGSQGADDGGNTPLLETVAHRIAASLHIPRVAILLSERGAFRPAYTLGLTFQILLPSVTPTGRWREWERMRRVAK